MEPRGGDRVGEASVDIAEWLHGLGLQQYEQSFRENAIDGAVLPELTADDLKDLGVSLVGHRRKLLSAIAALRSERGPEPRPEARGVADTSSAERRHLTVMFCDLVGSTVLSTRLDPEDLREIIGANHQAVAETVAGFDGFVAKYMGDGVLVYFGYPRAHEDDAERAVRAGLAAIEAVSRLDVRSVKLRARIGIATGLVVVGDLIGDGSAQEQSVVGETPNLAARLQMLAQASTLVIADSTRRQIGALFEFEDLGLQPLAGFAEPQRAWRVVRESGVTSRFEALRGEALTPFVGREEEIELLLRRWQRAITGEGQVVLLSGEAGIGKSRLVGALHERLAGEPHTRLRYFCSPHHQDSALHPFITQLERAAGFAREDTLETRLNKLEALLGSAAPPCEDFALLAELLSLPAEPRYPPLGLSPQRKKDKTFEALLRQLEGLARRQPVLFICEDLHWIDPSSRELLDRTINSATGRPVLLVATYRPEFITPWSGLPQVTTITLARFDRRAGTALVQQIAGGTSLTREVAAEIIERADGVPLFVEELTKAVVEAGGFGEGIQKTLAGALPSSFAVPSALHAPLMARLDRLGTAAKEVAQVAAAIGREFSYQLLAPIAGHGENELTVALGRLGDAGLVFCRGTPPNATYLFKHALVRDAAYASLLRRRREELHGRIAAALETELPDIAAAQPEIVAHHYTEAGLIEQAVPCWHRAGERAVARSANLEAIAYLERALEILRSLPDSAKRDEEELLLEAALIPPTFAAEGWGSARVERASARALELSHRTPIERPAHFYALFGVLACCLIRGDPRTALSVAKDCLQVAERRNDPLLIGIAHWLIGDSLLWLADLITARRHLENGLALCDPDRDRAEAARYGFDNRMACHSFLGRVLWHLGFPDQGVTHAEAAIAAARAAAHPFSEAFALSWAAALYQLRGEAELCRERAEAALTVANEQVIPFFGAHGMVLGGWAVIKQGQTEKGFARLRAGINAYHAIGAKIEEIHWLSLLADACHETGRIEEGLSILHEALGETEKTSIRYFEPELKRLEGELRRGHEDEQSEACFRRSIEIARAQQAKSFELRAALSLTRLWHDQGKSDEARDLLAPIYSWFTEGFDTADLKEAKALLDQLSA